MSVSGGGGRTDPCTDMEMGFFGAHLLMETQKFKRRHAIRGTCARHAVKRRGKLALPQAIDSKTYMHHVKVKCVCICNVGSPSLSLSTCWWCSAGQISRAYRSRGLRCLPLLTLTDRPNHSPHREWVFSLECTCLRLSDRRYVQILRNADRERNKQSKNGTDLRQAHLNLTCLYNKVRIL